MRSRIIVLVVALLAVALPHNVDALIPPVEMEDFRFVPKKHGTLIGFDVVWTNNGTVPHTATTRDSVPGAFSTTVNPGNSSAPTDFFDSVGSYAYFCQFHPNRMKGVVAVGISPDGTSKPFGNDFTLTVADSPGTSSSFDVQVREPGSDRFVTLFKDTTDNTLDFLPRRRGVYRLRGRTQDLDGTSTGWSGVLPITVT